jgi:hypothetical protein
MLTSWDARAFVRALGIGALSLLVAWLVTAATDEGSVPWGERAGRTLPMTPVCAAVGTWLALLPSRAKGEVRALAALGRAPWQNALGATAGGAATALAAAAMMAASGAVDVRGFYPTARHATEYRFEPSTPQASEHGNGGFVDSSDGWRIEADGTLTPPKEGSQSGAPANEGVPAHGRAAAASVTALAGIALPLVASAAVLAPNDARRRRGLRLGRRTRAALLVAASLAASVVLFHAAAVARAPAFAATIPPALLVLAAAAGLVRAGRPRGAG